MEYGFAVLGVAFLVTVAAVKVIRPLAVSVGLVDKPGGRKQHDGAIPLIGGLAMFVGLFLSSYIMLEQPTFVRVFMLGGAMIVFMGAMDDRYDISARFRLVAQLLIAALFVYGLKLGVASFGNLLGLGEIRLGWLGYPFALVAIIAVINAVNMLDGIDGLVGGLGLTSFMGLALLYFGASGLNTAWLCFALVGALMGFLVFNLWGKPSHKRFKKVFMGDAGSMFVGLALAVLLLYGASEQTAAFKPVTALWFVLLPLTDMITLMYRRVKRGKSPLSPDRTHIHHILMRAGFNSRQTLYIMLFVQLVLVCMGMMFNYLPGAEAISFSCCLVFVLAYQLLMKRSWRFIRWNKRRFAQ
ncbi:undecaprenyl-phosphate alpha-N-acetylglucosaminyl 1-phosphate transferase [Marinagarivorans algicola]|uniref:undecaprenyl-phosphate alpha-N-acetylglucosaminyl 1-phosphate transferase n=1 Tax=Marinagarivorans algicola TaxID=1513270 RepID=UPI0006B4052C|nr:undecaprenyl-phosphate alpha-N-acetylglucosaminyl 1-phosphate transferase [Marinagarivorans algicola]